MTTYDYFCLDCEQDFEVRMPMSEYSEGRGQECPRCGSQHVVRTFSSVNVLTSRPERSSSGPGCGPGCCC